MDQSSLPGRSAWFWASARAATF